MATLRSPFRYDFVGSFLRPQAIKTARAEFKAGEITRGQLTAVENEQITLLIEKQKRAGYHAITDGEFRRSYWHLDFMWGFAGIDEIELDHGYYFQGEETTHGSIRVSGKISGENHPFVEHYKFVKQFEDENCIARQTMPAPAQLLAELYREDNGKNTDAVYPDHEQLLQDIAALVAIDSVEGTPEEGAPFGAGPRAALDKTLELAAGMGLATRNCENYIGYAELAGADPEKYLATICHVDVVPVGNGWTADPFKMRIQDGWLLGRGVSDDKGPMIVTLYALKFLKEQGYQLRYPIRALIGDNEETHMQDVEYYLKNYPAPVFCFTPDAEFPVCNGEKGHFGGKIVSPVCNGVICDFEGGVANNAVPDRASALLHTDITKLKNAPNITLEPAGEGCVRVRGWGKAGHAAMPEGTVNAIGLVVNYLLDNGLCNDAERAYLEALRKLHASTAGTGLGIDCADGPFGPLTIIGGRIYMEDGRLVQTIDSRFPTCTDGDKLAAQVTAALGSGAQLQDVDAAEPFYIEADSPAIQACINTYNEVTGEDAKPFTMGGGTYARHFPYAVSFGPEHTDLPLPEFAGPMHGANEGANFDKLIEALKIYILALLRLQEIEL